MNFFIFQKITTISHSKNEIYAPDPRSDPVRREGPGRFADQGVEGINLGLAIDQNISAYKIYLIKERTIKATNLVLTR